jgi:hypothetical protein
MLKIVYKNLFFQNKSSHNKIPGSHRPPTRSFRLYVPPIVDADNNSPFVSNRFSYVESKIIQNTSLNT